jgi:tetratricopeptide (TPR) repeat protein
MKAASLKLLTAMALAAAVFSCSPAQKALRRSAKLEESGLSYEATVSAIQALESKRSSVNAAAEVKRLGNREVAIQVAEFRKLNSAGETVGALDAYVLAKDLEDRANRAGVLLTGTAEAASEYASARAGHVAKLRREGASALAAQDYDGAERLLTQALKYDPDNEVLRGEWREAVATPMYQEGIRRLQNRMWRGAHDQFSAMESKIGIPYRDSRSLMDSAVDAGRVTVGLRDVIAPTRQEMNLAIGLRGELFSQVRALNDPFIEWVDWSEQARFAATVQPDYIIELEMTDWTEVPGTMTRYERQGYRRELYDVKQPDGSTKKEERFIKVLYYDVDYRVFVRGALNAKLMQGSRILSQREVSEQMERIIASSEYSGDAGNLYPGQWSSIQEDKPGDRVNRGSKSSLDGRFRTRFDPSVVPTMRDQVRSALAAKAARELRGAIADPSFMP